MSSIPDYTADLDQLADHYAALLHNLSILPPSLPYDFKPSTTASYDNSNIFHESFDAFDSQPSRPPRQLMDLEWIISFEFGDLITLTTKTVTEQFKQCFPVIPPNITLSPNTELYNQLSSFYCDEVCSFQPQQSSADNFLNSVQFFTTSILPAMSTQLTTYFTTDTLMFRESIQEYLTMARTSANGVKSLASLSHQLRDLFDTYYTTHLSTILSYFMSICNAAYEVKKYRLSAEKEHANVLSKGLLIDLYVFNSLLDILHTIFERLYVNIFSPLLYFFEQVPTSLQSFHPVNHSENTIHHHKQAILAYCCTEMTNKAELNCTILFKLKTPVFFTMYQQILSLFRKYSIFANNLPPSPTQASQLNTSHILHEIPDPTSQLLRSNSTDFTESSHQIHNTTYFSQFSDAYNRSIVEPLHDTDIIAQYLHHQYEEHLKTHGFDLPQQTMLSDSRNTYFTYSSLYTAVRTINTLFNTTIITIYMPTYITSFVLDDLSEFLTFIVTHTPYFASSLYVTTLLYINMTFLPYITLLLQEVRSTSDHSTSDPATPATFAIKHATFLRGIYSLVLEKIFSIHLDNLEYTLSLYPVSLPAFIDIIYLQRLDLLDCAVPCKNDVDIVKIFLQTGDLPLDGDESGAFSRSFELHPHTYITQNNLYQTLLAKFVEVFIKVINTPQNHLAPEPPSQNHASFEVKSYQIGGNTEDEFDPTDHSITHLIKLYIHLIRLAPLLEDQQQQYIITAVTNTIKLNIVKNNLNFNFFATIVQLIYGNVYPNFSLDTIINPALLIDFNSTVSSPNHQNKGSLHKYTLLYRLPPQVFYGNDSGNNNDSSFLSYNGPLSEQNHAGLSKLAYADIILYRYHILSMHFSLQHLKHHQYGTINLTLPPNLIITTDYFNVSGISPAIPQPKPLPSQFDLTTKRPQTTKTPIISASHLLQLTQSLPSIIYAQQITEHTFFQNFFNYTHASAINMNNLVHLKKLYTALYIALLKNTDNNKIINNNNNPISHGSSFSNHHNYYSPYNNDIPHELQQLGKFYSEIPFSSLPSSPYFHDQNNKFHVRHNSDTIANVNNNDNDATILSDVDVENGHESLDSIQWRPPQIINIFSRLHFADLLLTDTSTNSPSTSNTFSPGDLGQLLSLSPAMVGSSTNTTNTSAFLGENRDLSSQLINSSSSSNITPTSSLNLTNYFSMLTMLFQNINLPLAQTQSATTMLTNTLTQAKSSSSEQHVAVSAEEVSTPNPAINPKYTALAQTFAIFFAQYNLSVPVLLYNTMHYKLLIFLLQYFSPQQLSVSINIYYDVLKSSELAYFFYSTKIKPLLLVPPPSSPNISMSLERPHGFGVSPALASFGHNLHLLIIAPSQWPDHFQYLGLFNSQRFLLNQIVNTSKDNDGSDDKSYSESDVGDQSDEEDCENQFQDVTHITQNAENPLIETSIFSTVTGQTNATLMSRVPSCPSLLNQNIDFYDPTDISYFHEDSPNFVENGEDSSLSLFNSKYLKYIHKPQYTPYQNNDILQTSAWFLPTSSVNSFNRPEHSKPGINVFSNAEFSAFMSSIWSNVHHCHPEMAYDMYKLYHQELRAMAVMDPQMQVFGKNNEDDNTLNHRLLNTNLIKLPHTIRMLFDEIIVNYKGFLTDYDLILLEHVGVVHLEIEVNSSAVESCGKNDHKKLVNVLCSPIACSLLMCFASEVKYATNNNESIPVFNQKEDNECEQIRFSLNDISQIVGVNPARARNILMYWVNMGCLEYLGKEVFGSVE